MRTLISSKSHLTKIWFHFISQKIFWFHFTRMWFCSDLISFHLMKIWSHLTKKWFHSDSVSSHFMKDWFHFMKMWSHLSFISSHLIKAWFHFSSDLKSEQNEIFWSQLSNIDYTIQKQQKVLLSSVINADIYNIYINIENQNNS